MADKWLQWYPWVDSWLSLDIWDVERLLVDHPTPQVLSPQDWDW